MNSYYIIYRCECCGKKLDDFECRMTFVEPPINSRDWLLCKKCTEKVKNFIKENQNGK